MGLSIAHQLASQGARPLLLEARALGAGSTGRSGAILRQHYSHELTARMARDSLVQYAAFEDFCGGSAGFVRTGMALVARAADREGLRQNLTLQQNLGIRTDELDPQGLIEAVPGLTAPDDVVGCYEPDAGYADPMRTVASLAAAVRRLGGEIREGSPVAEIVHDSAVRGVRLADGSSVEADRVVVAAGPWAQRVMATVGWETGVEPRRVECAVLRRPGEMWAGPVIIDFVHEFYAKHADTTHVGSILPHEALRADPDDFDEGVSGAYVRLAHGRAARRLPPLERATRFGGYGALYAVTPDWHPVIGPAGPQGLYLCAGFSGHGFKLAPSIGRSVAGELLGTGSPYDLGPLRPDRFQRGLPFTGRYAYSILG